MMTAIFAADRVFSLFHSAVRRAKKRAAPAGDRPKGGIDEEVAGGGVGRVGVDEEFVWGGAIVRTGR